MEKKQRVTGGGGGGGWAKWVRGIMESTPEIIVALDSNSLGCKLKKIKIPKTKQKNTFYHIILSYVINFHIFIKISYQI